MKQETIDRIAALENNAALLSIVLHALADLLAYDLSDGEQDLVVQATQAALELRRRNHHERREVAHA